MITGALLLTAAVAMMGSIVFSRPAPRVWLALTLGGCAAALAAAIGVLTSGAEWDWRGAVVIGGEPLHLRLDALSAMFVGLVALIGGAGAVYAREYWSDAEHPRSAPRGRAWWSGLVCSFGAVLLASNGLHFLIAWEVFTVCAFFLVTLDRRRREVRAAGWLYLAASHAGTVFLFAFFTALAARTGSWELGPMRSGDGASDAALAPLFWLALVGFGVKAGVFPLHIWLPSAHASAPSHVSAILSGVALKMGVYGIVRFSGWLPMPAAAGAVVIGLGVVSAVLGIACALAQNDLKRLLAYCSVENIAVIFIGVGGAMLAAAQDGAAWGRLAFAGALLHVWNHGLFKSLLFFGAGSVLHATGTREMSRLGGLWRGMPWTAALFAFGALAISGLPPLNGFVSEWLLYLGLFDAVTAHGPAAWVAIPAVLALALAGALALASFVKAGAIVFLGAARTKTAAHAHESGPLMRGAMLALAAACLAIGVAPMLCWPALARATGAWHPAWAAAAGEAPAPLSALGSAQAALALAAAAAAALLWRRARRGDAARRLTWDCGYAAPTARMQYTGGSWAGIAAGWLGWMVRPERKLRRPRGFFPANALRVERLPDAVLTRVIAPASGAVMRVSTAVRRLQHGRLQFYILYLVAGLGAIAALAAWEVSR